jgi:hypothetical protein
MKIEMVREMKMEMEIYGDKWRKMEIERLKNVHQNEK